MENQSNSTKNITKNVEQYYSEVLSSSKDLKTTACCSAEAVPVSYRSALKLIHPEIQDKFYGCGSPFPTALEGRTVLDLGCGTGRDVYILSKLVGKSGKVIGIDMTDAQLEVANKHLDYQMEQFGYSEPNVEFVKGYIEDLDSAGIADNSVDLIVSNCVINLSPDKPKVFSELWRVLKPGGELYFSDVFADRRIADEMRQDQVLHGECLSGALYLEDFRRELQNLGCNDFRIVSSSVIDISNKEVEAKIGMVNFTSKTVRAFKIDLEDRCEDYGQVATYNGGAPDAPHSFMLDDHHEFYSGKPMLVCGNTADMILKSHYAKYFEVQGNKDTHFGLFDCDPIESGSKGDSGACC